MSKEEIQEIEVAYLRAALVWIRKWHDPGEMPVEKYGTLEDWKQNADDLLDPFGRLQRYASSRQKC